MDFGDLLVYVVSYVGIFSSIYFILTLIRQRNELYQKVESYFPKVTITVPAYNEEKTLAGTIDSLLALNYPKEKLEIFVVDDGSTDNTLKIAKSYEKFGVRVFHRKNSGKGEALNFAIGKATGEFFGALDADSFADKDSVRKLVQYFENKKVMAVTPAMRIYNPNTILRKIQQVEYLFGVLLRKVFAMLGSIHVTPGPLSIYRMSFFKKYGGYDTHNLTEDIELALRIQKHHYIIENSILADVYTKGPKTFRDLMVQRLRWYKGFLDNLIQYKELFSRNHGNLGIFILPASFISVFLVIVSSIYVLVKAFQGLFNYLEQVLYAGFDWNTFFNFDIGLLLYRLDSTVFLGLIGVLFGLGMILLAKILSKDKEKLALPYLGYVFIYWFLFAFWWAGSIYYKIMGKKIRWAGKEL